MKKLTLKELDALRHEYFKHYKIHYDIIKSTVESYFGGIDYKTRLDNEVYKRKVLVYILRNNGYTFTLIGRLLGKDHSTIISLLNTYYDDLKYNGYDDFQDVPNIDKLLMTNKQLERDYVILESIDAITEWCKLELTPYDDIIEKLISNYLLKRYPLNFTTLKFKKNKDPYLIPQLNYRNRLVAILKGKEKEWYIKERFNYDKFNNKFTEIIEKNLG